MIENKFCIVMLSYNAQETIKRAINSLINQKYTNWECILIDDCSNDFTPEIIQETIGNDKRFIIEYNKQNLGGLYNRTYGTRKICKNDEDIVVILDGDDQLYDNEVLSYINKVYQNPSVWITYGQYVCETGDAGYCTDCSYPFYRLDHENRLMSHLRTYKFWLFKKIREEDLKDKNGNYYKYLEDAITNFPMAEMAGNHLKFTSRLSYIYNNKNPINDNKIHYQDCLKLLSEIKQKPAYMLLRDKADLPFQKMSIRLFDKNFNHCTYSGTDVNGSNYITWYRGPDYREFTFYTDKCLKDVIYDNSINIAWLLEPKEVDPDIYTYILSNYSKFNYVITHDKEILDNVPNSFFVPGAQTWISKQDYKIYNKEKDVCLIASLKKDHTGHRLRYDILDKCSKKIESVYGTKQYPFKNKIDVLSKYRYAIEVQNCKRNFYFTERLIDCFLTGTIPIFWGCPDIDKFFNPKGILSFSSIEELRNILKNTSESDYLSRIDAIKDNFTIAHKYILQEDYIYNYFFRRLLTETI